MKNETTLTNWSKKIKELFWFQILTTYWNSLTMLNLSVRLIGSYLFNISNYFMCPINNSKDTIYKGPSLYYVRVFWGFLVPPTPYVRTLHKVRENCHFLDHPPTPIALRNIKMVPKEIRNSRESHFLTFPACF